jgi:hypothetical protein
MIIALFLSNAGQQAAWCFAAGCVGTVDPGGRSLGMQLVSHRTAPRQLTASHSQRYLLRNLKFN